MVMLLALAGWGFELTAGNSYLSWRIYSRFSETKENQTGNSEQKHSSSKPAAKQRSTGSQILWYLPNRLVDLLDCFTFEVGGGEYSLDLQFTRFATFGGNIGYSGMLGWSANRQLGLYTQRIWNADFLNLNISETNRKSILGNYVKIYSSKKGAVSIENMIDEGAFDPFAIGARIGCYFTVNFLFHPVEFADFLAGWFLVDFREDDN